MKIKILYLVLLIISLRSTTLICTNKKPRDYSKAEVDKLTKDKTPRELARENLELRRRLSQTGPDLEMGLGAGSLAGAGVGISGTPPATPAEIRKRTSASTDELLVGNLSALTGVTQRQVDFQRGQTTYDRKTRRIAVVGTAVTIIYTTVGFIIQNWPSIISRFGGSSGPGGHPGNNTGTNSTSGF